MTVNAISDRPVRPRENVILRLFSSIWFGIVLLFLILVYASVGSALPQVRGAIEMTEMQVFKHWLFGTLVLLFSINLIVGTWRRMSWNALTLGALTVHAGLLLLIGGSAWYFGTKVEGDLLLQSPRIEVLSTSADNPRVLADVLAQEGQTWESFMPAFGGAARVSVLETKGEGGRPVNAATVRAELGGGQPRTVTVSADARAWTPIGDRLALRLRTFPPESKFYDREAAALFYRRTADAEFNSAPIHGLPLHRERYLDEGSILRDEMERPVPSKRTRAEIVIGGLRIPTGWFEPWRMPIRLDAPGLPFDVEVTGYVPYVQRLATTAAGGGSQEYPVIGIQAAVGDESLSRSLAAFDPRESLLEAGLSFEFRWVRTAAERDELFRSLAGPHELYIEVLDPPVTKTVAITAGAKIAVEGTPYELAVKSLLPSWPLMTPGHEGARSPTAQIDVACGDKRYQRTVVQRFPQFSQDIDEQDVRHREAPYDSNLILRYRSSADGWIMIVAGPDLAPALAVFDADGSVDWKPTEVGRAVPLHVLGAHLNFTLTSFHRNGRQVVEPVITPIALRRPGLDRQMSALRLKLTGRGPQAGWTDTQWCLFSSYPDVDARPIRVQLPGDATVWELVYSREEHDLGAALAGRKLSVTLFPGRQNVESWRSDFLVQPHDGSPPYAAAVYTNQTFLLGEWALFQSGAATDHWRWTILGVGNRRGIWPMVLGCAFITVGCLYAFYVKPVLKHRRAARAVNEPRGQESVRPTGRPQKAEESELVEVRS